VEAQRDNTGARARGAWGSGDGGVRGGGGGATRLYVTMDVCVCSPTTKRVKRLLRGNMSLEALSPPCKSCP
jgi:hypothetical protein